MWDQHMHCMFSGDSDADPVLMINSAINKGLDGICFTDHLDYDYKEEPALFICCYIKVEKTRLIFIVIVNMVRKAEAVQPIVHC